MPPLRPGIRPRNREIEHERIGPGSGAEPAHDPLGRFQFGKGFGVEPEAGLAQPGIAELPDEIELVLLRLWPDRKARRQVHPGRHARHHHRSVPVAGAEREQIGDKGLIARPQKALGQRAGRLAHRDSFAGDRPRPNLCTIGNARRIVLRRRRAD